MPLSPEDMATNQVVFLSRDMSPDRESEENLGSLPRNPTSSFTAVEIAGAWLSGLHCASQPGWKSEAMSLSWVAALAHAH